MAQNARKTRGDVESGQRGERTTWAQKHAIVCWLEESSNFALITGNATAELTTVVAGAKTKKSSAYALLAD